jgi:predicted MFS family arabinose efflux permease
MNKVALPLGLLSAAGFLSSAGARVIDPLLHVIASDFSASIPAVSIVVAAFTLPYGACQLVLGPVGDKFGKLRVILGALLAYALATGACALASDLTTLTLLRAGAGAASAGLIPIGLAYIGDSVAYEERQVTLSRFLTGIVLAQTLAGPIGGVFGDYIGWRGVFLVLAAGALGVAALLARRINTLPDKRSGRATFRLSPYAGLLRGRSSRLLLLGALLDGMVLVGAFPFLAPYLRERFGLPYAAIGLVLACFGLGAVIYIRSAKWLVRRLGEPGMALGGGLLMAAGMLAAVTLPWWPAFVGVELALGLGFFTLHGVLQARATEMLPHARATAVSAFACLLFLGQSIGAPCMGLLIGTLGYRAAFALDAVGGLLLTLWLAHMLRRASTTAAAG